MKKLIILILALAPVAVFSQIDPACPSCGPRGLPPDCREICHANPDGTTTCHEICR